MRMQETTSIVTKSNLNLALGETRGMSVHITSTTIGARESAGNMV